MAQHACRICGSKVGIQNGLCKDCFVKESEKQKQISSEATIISDNPTEKPQPQRDEFSMEDMIGSWNDRNLRKGTLFEERNEIQSKLDVEIKCIEELEKKLIAKMVPDKVYPIGDGKFITVSGYFGSDSKYIRMLELGETK